MNINDTIPQNVANGVEDTSVWMWLALAELIVINFLLYKLWRCRHARLSGMGFSKNDLRHTDSTNVGMDNLINSITKSDELYKELSRKYHPDKFVNTPLYPIAQELFQKISEHKKNYYLLSQLKEEAIAKLKIE